MYFAKDGLMETNFLDSKFFKCIYNINWQFTKKNDINIDNY